jgi:hypothetical protein
MSDRGYIKVVTYPYVASRQPRFAQFSVGAGRLGGTESYPADRQWSGFVLLFSCRTRATRG